MPRPTMSYTCEVWQSEQSVISTQDNSVLTIHLFATHIAADYHNPSLLTTSYRHYKFTAQRNLLLDKTISWSMISKMLSRALVPFHAQPSMIHKIWASVQEIFESRPGNLALIVSLFVVDEELPLERGRARVSGVTRKVRVKLGFDDDEKEEIDCVICLEGILGSSREVVARLPCLHFYHEDCILNWLEKSNLCPLCRNEVPLDL